MGRPKRDRAAMAAKLAAIRAHRTCEGGTPSPNGARPHSLSRSGNTTLLREGMVDQAEGCGVRNRGGSGTKNMKLEPGKVASGEPKSGEKRGRHYGQAGRLDTSYARDQEETKGDDGAKLANDNTDGMIIGVDIGVPQSMAFDHWMGNWEGRKKRHRKETSGLLQAMKQYTEVRGTGPFHFNPSLPGDHQCWPCQHRIPRRTAVWRPAPVHSRLP